MERKTLRKLELSLDSKLNEYSQLEKKLKTHNNQTFVPSPSLAHSASRAEAKSSQNDEEALDLVEQANALEVEIRDLFSQVGAAQTMSAMTK